MKRILFVLLVLMAPLFGQELPAANWGIKIPLGTQFRNTDSLQVLTTSLRDTLLADTLYSSVLPLPDAGTSGVWRVVNYFTELSSEAGTMDSCAVDVRFYHAFSYPSTNSIMNLWGVFSSKPASRGKFTAWKPLKVADAAGALNILNIAQSDSSWWGPASGRQYRVYSKDASTDTALVDLTDYLD